jgi:hypothetical protein
MTLTGSFQVTAALLQSVTRDFGVTTDSAKFNAGHTIANGTGAAQADRLWSDTRTLAASATEDLDLVGTTLLDGFGNPVTFPKVTGLVVRAAAGNTNSVVVGAATAAWATLLNSTGTVTLRPGAVLAVFAGATDASGWATTATSADILKVANSAGGTSVSYDIMIIGKSA